MSRLDPYRILLVVLVAVGGLLMLPRLGTTYLWQDEAQTAVLAETIQQYGVPRGYDGQNFFSQELGAEYGPNHIWRWHTWLPFYVTAGFFGVFGKSTWVARLPFVLFGLATLPVLYAWSRLLWRDRLPALLAAACSLFCIPSLLLTRQCRYYSLASCLALCSLYAYSAMMQRKRHGAVLFVLAATLLFHTHYIYTAAVIGTVLAHCALFHRERWRPIALGSAAVLVLNGPWLVWMSGMRYGERYGEQVATLGHFWFSLSLFVGQLVNHVFGLSLIVLTVVVVAWILVRHRGGPEGSEVSPLASLSLIGLFLAVNLALLSVFAPFPFFRYLAPLLPVVAVATGFLIWRAARVHLALGLVAGILWLAMGPWTRYVYELTHDFDGPIEGIVRHLEEHANDDDVVAISYGDMPLKFYTDLRVVGGLTGEDLTPARRARWLIIRGHVVSEKDQAVAEELLRIAREGNYRAIRLDAPDTMFENRESPDEHFYRTQRQYPPVVLLERAE